MNKQPAAWQTQLMNGIDDIPTLLQLLGLDNLPNGLTDSEFPLKVPLSYIRRMKLKDPQDPLLLQILPQTQELQKVAGFERDPLHEEQYNPLPGLIHKYQGRVLLTLTGVCSVNCRYCFRRHFPYQENNPGKLGWDKVLGYLRDDISVEEVILSGGDPLMLPDRYLQNFIQQLEAIPHLKRLRIHSRLPIVLPERMTPDLLQALSNNRFERVLVLHCNHPQEIDASVKLALQPFRGIFTLLNQAVLLQGINDNSDVLIDLSKTLFEIGVLPYYLHMLDKVEGAAHFDVPVSRAKQLWEILLVKLPGYLVPRLVSDKPGQASKTWIFV